MVKFEINNNEIDFEKRDDLPFSLDIAIDDFFDLKSIGTVLSNSASRILLPGTNRNKSVLLGSGEGWKDLKIYDDNFEIKGRCFVTEKVVEKGEIIGIGIDFVANLFDIAMKLNELYLDTIDAGNFVWSDTVIQNSWAGSSDNQNQIFAPVLYGQVSGTSDGFLERDLMPQIYAKHIIESIFSTLGYVVNSDLMDSEWFKAIVLIHSQGLLKTISKLKCQTVIFTTVNLASSADIPFDTALENGLGIWDSSGKKEFTIPSVQRIKITANIFTSDATNTAVFKKNGLEIIEFDTQQIFEYELDAEAGDVFTVAYRGATATVSSNTTLKIESDFALLGETINLNSGLPHVTAKKFLSGILHMTNSLIVVNPILKQVRIEPRFEWFATSGMKRGYYHLPQFSTPRKLRLENSYVTKKDIDGVRVFEFSYMETENTILEDFYGRNPQTVPFFGCRAGFNNLDINAEPKGFPNPIFSPLLTGYSVAITNYRPLPLMLPNDFEYKDELPVATYKNDNLHLALVSGTTKINYKGSVETVPFLSQTKAVDGINLSFCETFSGYNGLVKTFYSKWLAVIQKAETVIVNGVFNREDAINENFRTLCEFQGAFYIFNKIKDFNLLEREKTKAVLIRYVEKQDNITYTGEAIENSVYVDS
jgi:hypothetical protein